MIKLGSRTELILPDEPGLTIEVGVGQRVKAGSSVMADTSACRRRVPRSVRRCMRHA